MSLKKDKNNLLQFQSANIYTYNFKQNQKFNKKKYCS